MSPRGARVHTPTFLNISWKQAACACNASNSLTRKVASAFASELNVSLIESCTSEINKFNYLSERDARLSPSVKFKQTLPRTVIVCSRWFWLQQLRVRAPGRDISYDTQSVRQFQRPWIGPIMTRDAFHECKPSAYAVDYPFAKLTARRARAHRGVYDGRTEAGVLFCSDRTRERSLRMAFVRALSPLSLSIG